MKRINIALLILSAVLIFIILMILNLILMPENSFSNIPWIIARHDKISYALGSIFIILAITTFKLYLKIRSKYSIAAIFLIIELLLLGIIFILIPSTFLVMY